MVADAWKPSVVKLVPFADQNIQRSNSFKDTTSSSINDKRCFPILAVTRSNSGISVDDSVISVDTYSTLTLSDYQSEVSESVPFSGRTPTVSVKGDIRFRKSARHSSMRENRNDMMVKFAIQDLNEQSGTLTSRRNSISSIDTGVSLSSISANGSIISNGLPKPTLADKKYLYRQQGLKKSATFTPGEIELQRQKEQYTKEQAQKKKKYKLNVNQLPRSNTPINDHDPDKLNMKQVIRFLQTQKPAISPRPDTRVTKSPERRIVENTPKTAPAHLKVGDKIRSDLKTSDSMRSRTSEISIASRSKSVSRDNEISTRTSPSHNTRFHMSHKNETTVTNSYTSMKDKHTRSFHDNSNDRDRNRQSRKRVREFHLHRFLALAPNGEGQKTKPLIITNLTKTRSNNLASMREGLKSEGGEKMRSKSEDRISNKRVSSEKLLPSHFRTVNKHIGDNKTDTVCEINVDALVSRCVSETDKYNIGKTTTLMQQRTIRFQKLNLKDDTSISDSDDCKVSLANSSMIRLPSVHDFIEDEDDESTLHDSSKSDLETKGSTHDNEPDNESKRETNVSRISDSSRSSVALMPMLPASARKGFSSKLKHSIHVNLPKGEEETKEIRLSLRQEKDLTAQRSYMLDIASARSAEHLTMMYKDATCNGHILSSSDTYCDRNLIRISPVSMQNRKTEDNTLYDEQRLSPDAHVTPRSVGALSIS